MRFVQFPTIFACIVLSLPVYAQSLKFSDISHSSGVSSPVDTTGYGHGVTVADFNNDGYPDIYPAMYEIYNPLYINNHNRTFSNQASSWNVAGRAGWLDRGIAAADYNNDGKIDILLNNAWEPSALFRNNGSSFTDVATDLWINFRGQAQGVLWFDMNNDGLLDLFFPSYSSESELYVQRSDGKFENRTGSAWLGNTKFAISAIAVDVNNDGLQDIFVTRGEGYSNLLLINRNGYSFKDEAERRGIVDTTAHSQGVTAGDFDNDGDIDIYVANANGTNLLYRNNGSGYFRDEAWNAGVGDWHRSLGAHFADFNNDGWLDLYVVNFGTNRLYRNLGNGTFREESSGGAGGQSFWASYGSAVADFDQDGDLDIFFTNSGQQSTLFDNRTQAGNWIAVGFEGSNSNRDGIGAKVDFWVNGRRQHNQMRSSDGFVSGAIVPLHFGLGDAASADSIIVRWPSGTTTRLTRVDANQKIIVREAGGTEYRRFEINFTRNSNTGLENLPLSGGIAVIDYNADGLPDLFATDATGREFFLLQNQGGNRFVRRDSQDGPIPDDVSTTSFIFADYDADGDDDLITASSTYGQAKLVLYRFFDGRFSRDDRSMLPYVPADSVHFMFFGQIDADGVDDLFLIAGGERRSLIFLGNPDGGFTLSADGHGLPSGIVRARLLDFDRDGDVDVLAVRNGILELYDNAAGLFSLQSLSGLPQDNSIRDFRFADLNADGLGDFLLTSAGAQAYALYVNTGTAFTQTWQQSAADSTAPAAPALPIDFDNDGDLDLLLPSAASGLYENTGGSFSPVSAARSGLPQTFPGLNHSLVLDTDSDGQQDILTFSTAGAGTLYGNARSTAGNWVKIRVAGHGGRADAVGAVLRLLDDTGLPVAVHRVSGDNSGGEQRSGIQHFGLGEQTAASIEITYPGGQRETLATLPLQQTLRTALQRPIVTIISPQPGEQVYGDSIHVRGAVWDRNITRVTLNGAVVDIRDGRFSHTFAALPGEVGITAAVVAPTGEQSRVSLTVTLVEDRQAPELVALEIMPILPTVIIQATADEPVRYVLDYGTRPEGGKHVQTSNFHTTAALVLEGLSADSIYYADLTLIDRAGNKTRQTLRRFKPYAADFTLNLPPAALDNQQQNATPYEGRGGAQLAPGDSLTTTVTIPEPGNYFILLNAESWQDSRVRVNIGGESRLLSLEKDASSYGLALVALTPGEQTLVLSDATQSTGTSTLSIREVSILGPDAGDVLPPFLETIAGETLSPTSLRLSWQSDEPASGTLRYSLFNSSDTVSLRFDYALSHAVQLDDLWPDSTYTFALFMHDSSGNSELYSGNTFATKVENDGTIPFVTETFIQQTGATSFRINWKSSEPVRSWIELDKAAGSYRSPASSEYSQLHSHTVSLPNSEGSYGVSLFSRDYSGNLSVRDTLLTLPDAAFIAFYEAESLQTRVGGRSEAGLWLANAGGYLAQRISFPDSGMYSIRFSARSLSSEDSTVVTLSVAGDSLASFAVTGDSVFFYAASGFIPGGEQEIRLHWQNDPAAEGAAFVQFDWLDVVRGKTTNVENPHNRLLPAHYRVSEAYPNPFNPSTSLRISLPQQARVRLHIFNITGRVIFSSELGELNAGEHILRWHGHDQNGRIAGSGIYYARIEILTAREGRRYIFNRKLSLLK